MARRYRMGARALSVEETKDRIVQAAKGLHAGQGLQGTSYEEIAFQASVSQATVYRHFPTLEELIPACASSIEVLQPITPEAAENLFAGRSRPLQRIEWIIRGTCDCYARDEGWLQAARREGDLIPSLAEVVRVEQKSLRTLVRAALKDTGASERTVQVLSALIDFPLWKSLRDEGLSAAEATSQILDLVHDQLAKQDLI